MKDRKGCEGISYLPSAEVAEVQGSCRCHWTIALAYGCLDNTARTLMTVSADADLEGLTASRAAVDFQLCKVSVKVDHSHLHPLLVTEWNLRLACPV